MEAEACVGTGKDCLEEWVDLEVSRLFICEVWEQIGSGLSSIIEKWTPLGRQKNMISLVFRVGPSDPSIGMASCRQGTKGHE